MFNAPISEFMSREVLTLSENALLGEALKILVKFKVTGIPIVNSTGKMIGVYSEYDLIRQVQAHQQMSKALLSTPIEFSRSVKAVTPETSVDEVLRLFMEERFRRLPVLDETGKLVGIITRRDLMRAFYYQAQL